MRSEDTANEESTVDDGQKRGVLKATKWSGDEKSSTKSGIREFVQSSWEFGQRSGGPSPLRIETAGAGEIGGVLPTYCEIILILA